MTDRNDRNVVKLGVCQPAHHYAVQVIPPTTPRKNLIIANTQDYQELGRTNNLDSAQLRVLEKNCCPQVYLVYHIDVTSGTRSR